MDVWVTQWSPEVQSTSSRLVNNPQDLWAEVQGLLKEHPDEHIVIVPAD